MLLDKLAERTGADKEKKQGKALIRQAESGANRILLVKPQSFMNLSGDPLWEILCFYKDRIDDMIVAHDDMDLPLGKLRFRSNGGTGGHKGLLSITKRLGDDEYDRLKIGIGRPDAIPAEDYVLRGFPAEQRAELDKALDAGVRAILYWLDEGIQKTMNRYNGELPEGN
jgi:PTH1 family peptidyl-tRNA hydrolase